MMTMPARLVRARALAIGLAAIVAGLAPRPAAAGGLVMPPGREQALIELLNPPICRLPVHWSLLSVRAGGGCEVRYSFQLEQTPAIAVEIHLECGRIGPGCRIDPGAGDKNVGRPLVVTFRQACDVALLERGVENLCLSNDTVAGPTAPAEGAEEPAYGLVLLAGLLVAAGVLGVVCGTWLECRLLLPVATGAILLTVLGTRLYHTWHAAPDPYEFSFLWSSSNIFHSPFHEEWLMRGWSAIGERFGLGLSLFWLRLPNVGLSLAVVWLLLSFGRVIGRPIVGLAAAALFAGLPAMLQLSIMQTHHFWELATALWFVERLAWHLGRRGMPFGLLAAGAAALWTGYMTALLVVPGTAILLVSRWRRGERRHVLLSVLILCLACLPLLSRVTAAVPTYLLSSQAIAPAADGSGIVAGNVHPVMDPAAGIGQGRAFRLVPGIVYSWLWRQPPSDREAAVVLILFGIALGLLIRQPLAWVAVGALAATSAVSTVAWLRLNNTSFLWPLMLTVPFWAAARLPGRISAAFHLVMVVAALGLATAHPRETFDINNLVSRVSLAGLRDALAKPGLPARLLFLSGGTAEAPLLAWELCGSPGSAEAYRECARPGTSVALPGHSLVWWDVAGRRVAVLGVTGDADRQAETVRSVLSDRPWRNKPYLLLVPRNMAARGSAIGRVLPADCRLHDWTDSRHELFECGPGGSAPAGQDAGG